MRPSHPLLQAITLLASLRTASGVGFDCAYVVDDGVKWDLSPLRGPKSVHSIFPEPPTIRNFTFTLDICAPLKPLSSVPKTEQCEMGTWICGVEYMDKENETDWEVVRVVPVAGSYAATSGRHLEAKPTRLKDSDSNTDSGTEGVRLEFSGDSKDQKAIIEFICDSEKTGDEGFEDTEGMEDGEVEKREEEDEELPNPQDDGKSLKFLSYKEEQVKGSKFAEVLRLEWRTKYACEDVRDVPTKSGWGFFTWFIIVLFLAVAAYLIFGSWLNYNRYGARGWDLLPHGDMIRDIPYIMRDWGRRVVNTVQGGGSRGGYSAL